MQRPPERKASNPTKNLVQAGVAKMQQKNLIEVMDKISQQTPDEHGNIWLGIDDVDFKLWEVLQNYVSTKLFGPVMVPTNLDVITAILNEQKVGEQSEYLGNKSTDVMTKLAGGHTIFSAANNDIHKNHKVAFKNYLSDTARNTAVASPIVKKWLEDNLIRSRKITGKETTILAAKVIIAFLLNPAAAENSKFVTAVSRMKNHFSNTVSSMFINWETLPFYESAQDTIKKEILRLCASTESSYPKFLHADENGPKFTVEQTISHIISTVEVGFENLQSSIISTLLNYSKYPMFNSMLFKELKEENGCDVIPLIPNFKNPTFGQRYFEETLRNRPPVWMQARKNKPQDREIKYHTKNEKGERVEKTFNLKSASLVLIPNYQLMHAIERGNSFDPTRERPKDIPSNFSVGINACPGRNIAYATDGCLLANMIQMKVAGTVMKEGELEPKVALKDINFEIELATHDAKYKPLVR